MNIIHTFSAEELKQFLNEPSELEKEALILYIQTKLDANGNVTISVQMPNYQLVITDEL